MVQSARVIQELPADSEGELVSRCNIQDLRDVVGRDGAISLPVIRVLEAPAEAPVPAERAGSPAELPVACPVNGINQHGGQLPGLGVSDLLRHRVCRDKIEAVGESFLHSQVHPVVDARPVESGVVLQGRKRSVKRIRLQQKTTRQNEIPVRVLAGLIDLRQQCGRLA